MIVKRDASGNFSAGTIETKEIILTDSGGEAHNNIIYNEISKTIDFIFV